jgi:hypothetical protein
MEACKCPGDSPVPCLTMSTMPLVMSLWISLTFQQEKEANKNKHRSTWDADFYGARWSCANSSWWHSRGRKSAPPSRAMGHSGCAQGYKAQMANQGRQILACWERHAGMVVKLRNNAVGLQSRYTPSPHTKFCDDGEMAFESQHHRPIESRLVHSFCAHKILGRKVE